MSYIDMAPRLNAKAAANTNLMSEVWARHEDIGDLLNKLQCRHDTACCTCGLVSLERVEVSLKVALKILGAALDELEASV